MLSTQKLTNELYDFSRKIEEVNKFALEKSMLYFPFNKKETIDGSLKMHISSQGTLCTEYTNMF